MGRGSSGGEGGAASGGVGEAASGVEESSSSNKGNGGFLGVVQGSAERWCGGAVR